VGLTLRPWSEHLAEGVGADGLDLVAGRSLPVAWRQRWEDEPGHVVAWGEDGGALTANDLDERSALAAARLAASGVAPGDRVVVSAPASVDFVVAYVGIHRLGAVAVPLNQAYTAREVTQVVTDAQPTAAIVAGSDMAGWVTTATPDAAVTPPDLSGMPLTGRRGGPDVALDTVGPDDTALLCYTSGTTGAPKGVPLSHGNLLASAEAVRLAWRWQPDDELILALPLFHVHGLGVGLHGTLVAGATVQLHARFDPARALAAARDTGTMFFGVPTMWHRLAADPSAADLGRLRLGVSGSAQLPADLHAAIT